MSTLMRRDLFLQSKRSMTGVPLAPLLCFCHYSSSQRHREESDEPQHRSGLTFIDRSQQEHATPHRRIPRSVKYRSAKSAGKLTITCLCSQPSVVQILRTGSRSIRLQTTIAGTTTYPMVRELR